MPRMICDVAESGVQTRPGTQRFALKCAGVMPYQAVGLGCSGDTFTHSHKASGKDPNIKLDKGAETLSAVGKRLFRIHLRKGSSLLSRLTSPGSWPAKPAEAGCGPARPSRERRKSHPHEE